MVSQQAKDMKALIINADDMGTSTYINSAIMRLYKNLAITGTSINACGPAFAQGCRLLKESGINEAGVHFTFTENFKPVNFKGCFPASYISLSLKLLLGIIKMQELKDELRFQIEKIRNEGFTITHMDSHEHVHILPWIWDIALELCKEFSIPYIRIPLENRSVSKISFTVKDAVRSAALRFFSKKTYKGMEKYSLCSSNAFFGHFHSGRLTGDILSFMADNMPDAITELVVHPADYSDELLKSFPFYKNGPNEVSVLMSDEWKKKLKSLGITLISHADACVILSPSKARAKDLNNHKQHDR
jgi:chitin disaccharide deacetylase